MDSDFMPIAILLAIPLASALGAILIRVAMEIVVKFRPSPSLTFTMAYFSYAACCVISMIFAVSLREVDERLSLAIWVSLGVVYFVVQVAICSRLRKHPAVDPIGLGKAFQVGIVQICLIGLTLCDALASSSFAVLLIQSLDWGVD